MHYLDRNARRCVAGVLRTPDGHHNRHEPAAFAEWGRQRDGVKTVSARPTRTSP
jgi:hypothetical protein